MTCLFCCIQAAGNYLSDPSLVAMLIVPLGQRLSTLQPQERELLPLLECCTSVSPVCCLLMMRQWHGYMALNLGLYSLWRVVLVAVASSYSPHEDHQLAVCPMCGSVHGCMG